MVVFGVPWIWASHVTGSSGGQPDQHRKGGLCRWQRCFPDAKQGLGEWALWFRSRECDAERWSLAAGSWDWDWRRSNCPWGLFYVLIHVSRMNTVARFCTDESVQPNEISSGSSESWSQHLTFGNIYLAADTIPPGIHIVLLLGWHPSFGMCFLIYRSLLHEFRSQCIGLGLYLLAGTPV